MKNIFAKLMFAAVALMGLVAAGCSDDETNGPASGAASVEIITGSTGATYAGLTIRTTGIATYAYLVYSEEVKPETAPSEIVLFATGAVAEAKDGNNVLSLSGLTPNTTFHIYLAAQTTHDTYYGEVLTTSFTTLDTDDEITVVEQTPDGFTLYVNTPQDVMDRGNIIRYYAMDIASYNYAKSGLDQLNGYTSDARLLIQSDRYIGGETGQTAIIHYSNDDVVAGEGDEAYYTRNPMSPGEPTVMIFGEFTGDRYGTPMYDNPNEDNGGGGGGTPVVPMVAPVDQERPEEDPYWTGYHTRFMTSTLDPEPLDAKFNMTVDVQNAARVVVNLAPDEAIRYYSIFMADDTFYKDTILNTLLDGNEDYMQWFTASFFCYNTVYALNFQNEAPIQFDFHYHNYVYPETTYHIFLTGMGDQSGSTQTFEHYTFTTPKRELPVPEVVVTPIPNPSTGEQSPNEVWFNVKCPSGNAEAGMYAVNYAKEWDAMIAAGATNAELIQMGGSFTVAELAYINSDQGYDISFSSLDGMTSRMGVMLFNAEDVANDPDIDGSAAIAEQTTPEKPLTPRIDSPLFAELTGDWTATAYVSIIDQGLTREWFHREEPMVTKISIHEKADYPEKVDEFVYDVYAGLDEPYNREEVDAFYEEFKTGGERFNKRMQSANRLLCMGWSSEDQFIGQVAYPYDLFYSTTYNSWDPTGIFDDFGPKWYLEVHEDGTVTCPVSMSGLAPMSGVTDLTYYLIGVTDTGNFENISGNNDYSPIHFPVEISEDKNTITIKPLEKDGLTYYPTTVYVTSYGNVVVSPRVVSEVVLTRGWSGEDEVAPAAMASAEVGSTVLPVDKMMQPAARTKHHRRTVFTDVKSYEKRDLRPVDRKMLDEVMQQRLESLGIR